MTTQRGKYIVIEGNEGSGKTTQCEVIKKWLRQVMQLSAIAVREPGGDPFGEALREVIKNPAFEHAADEELLVFTAARMGMRRRKVVPALESGQWVISDRSELSTFVYQGFGGHLDLSEIAQTQQKVAEICRPDLFILLKISPEVSQARLKQRNEAPDSFESRDTAYQQRISDGYSVVGAYAREIGYVVIDIDGNQPQVMVTEAIKDIIVNQFFRPVD